MRIGTRVISKEDVRRWDAEIYQVSMYKGWIDDTELMQKCVSACRDKGVPYVIHPVGFRLLERDSFLTIKAIASEAGEALILHDEKEPDEGRLSGSNAKLYKKSVSELESISPLSFENATDTPDAIWFWQNFAGSVTLDIGHVEAAGINSVKFVNELDEDIIDKIQYVHIHHNGELRNGLTDHHPLNSGCREIKALKGLLERKDDFAVILEINETEMIKKNLALLKDLRNRHF